MKTRTISKAEFTSWKHDVVTQAVMETLKEIQASINSCFEQENFLLGNQLQIAKCVGVREALKLMIDIECEDLPTEGEEE